VLRRPIRAQNKTTPLKSIQENEQAELRTVKRVKRKLRMGIFWIDPMNTDDFQPPITARYFL
jgi:hypothetical protein